MLQTTAPHIITTQIDSLHTQVQIIDTTVTHVHVYDTIVTHVYDTIPPDLIAVYDKLITAQDNNFDNILILITIIVTVLIVVFTAYNFFGAKKLFKIEFKKMIEDERENIKESALEEVEKELNGVKAEHARGMALSFRDDKDKPMTFLWWSECLFFATKSESDYLIKASMSEMLKCLRFYEKLIPDFLKRLETSKAKLERIERNLMCMPPLMTESDQISKRFEKFKKECPDSMKSK